MITPAEILACYAIQDDTAGTIPQVVELRNIVPIGVVAHHTGVGKNPDGSLGNSLGWLQGGAYRAWQRGEVTDFSSADQLIRMEGGKAVIHKITRLSGDIHTDQMSYHSGRSIWQGSLDERRTLNRLTIGIEVEHSGHVSDPYPLPLEYALGATMAYLVALYKMPDLSWLTSHRVVAQPPGRKTDPSDKFNWARVYEAFWALRRDWPASWGIPAWNGG